MSKFFKTFLHGVKYAVYLGGATVVGGFGYLTYINSRIGGIDVDKEITTKYYNEKMGIEMGEATQMYYWLLWDIAIMRVLTYNSYSNYCDRLNRKII